MTIEAADLMAVAGLTSICAGLYMLARLPAVFIELGAVLTVTAIWLARVRVGTRTQERKR